MTTLVVAQAGTLGSAWRLWDRSRDALDAFDLARKGSARGLAQLEADEIFPKPKAGEEANGTWSVAVADEGGRLNVNFVPWTILAHLPEATVNMAQAIVARREERPLQSLAELALIPGVTHERLEKWAPLLRAFGEQEVNLNSASQGVLEALGLARSTAGTLLAWRDGPDGVAGTQDDRIFRQTGDMAPAISKFLRAEEAAALMGLVNAGQLGTRSTSFRMSATGKAGTSQRVLTLLVERQAPGIPPKIKGWHETTSSGS
ncbi:MAG: general secretion pathway protein GspK [Elusimicrobia bacterium]|nr:general secretion pathway protein GspK [Elusimicrobiota bacterium]